jgi:hypothetical protein
MSKPEHSPNPAAGTFALAFALMLLGGAALPAAGRAQQPLPHALFRLSTCSSCAQHDPVVAGNAGGSLLTAWNSVIDAAHLDVSGRFFAATGAPLGADFQPAAGAAGPPQFSAATAADAQGNFILVWVTLSADQSTVLAQRYDPLGNPLGAAVEVASDPASSPSTPADFNPAVVAVPSGGFVVAWVRLLPDSPSGSPPQVMARRFTAAGTPAAPAVQLSTGLASGDRPSLCVSSTGRIHAAWTFADAYKPFEANLVGVVVRRVTPAGVPVGPEQVVEPPVLNESSVAISCGPTNTYTVLWQTTQPPATSGSDIVAQRFTRLGQPNGAPYLVNQVVDQEQRNPAVISDAAGNFLAVWEGMPGGVNGVAGRRFSAAGAPLSNEFTVFRSLPGDLSILRPAVAAVGAGFAVVLDAPGGLVGRRFTLPAAGTPAIPDAGNGSGEAGLW